MQVNLITGHVLEALRSLPAESVHCVVTSPPYFWLRDYGIEPVVWGGEGKREKEKGKSAGCEHEWGEDSFCRGCGAWRGCLGLEPTIELFVQHLVEVFREVRRVLRKDGVCFVNLRDSYASSKGKRKASDSYGKKSDSNQGLLVDSKAAPGLKPKDLCGVPWRVALALQADGWWLRSDIVWSKPNPMPESVNGWRWEPHRVKVGEDYQECPGCAKCRENDGLILRKGAGRPTLAHEYLFVLTRSATGFWDTEAVREAGSTNSHGGGKFHDKRYLKLSGRSDGNNENFANAKPAGKNGRNLRSVWNIATAPFPAAHFATFPPALVEKCIKAGTSEKGACGACGSPWVRVVERTKTFESGSGKSGNQIMGKNGPVCQGGGDTGDIRKGPCLSTQTLGFRPSCDCRRHGKEWPEAILDPFPPAPATVLDPFSGAGTTCLVAAKMGRHVIGIEMKPEYQAMAEKRIKGEMGMLVEITCE